MRAVTAYPTFRVTLTLGKGGLEAELEVVHPSGCSGRWDLVYHYAGPCSAMPDAWDEPLPDAVLSPDALEVDCDGGLCEGDAG